MRPPQGASGPVSPLTRSSSGLTKGRFEHSNFAFPEKESREAEQFMSKLARAYDRSRIPLYVQVASVIRQRIETGYWQAGQKISTLDELEQEFEVARVTVRQAIELLREEDLLRCQQGRGTFAAEEPPNKRWL